MVEHYVALDVVVIVRMAKRVIVFPMNVRMGTSTMAMIKTAHDIDRMRSNRKRSLL